MVPKAAVVYISDVPWGDVKKTSRAYPDLYLITVPTLSLEDIPLYLAPRFPALIVTNPSILPPAGLPSLTAARDDLVPLPRHFLPAVYDICSPHCQDPGEIAYVVSVTWLAFVTLVLADRETIRTSRVLKNAEDMHVDQDVELDVGDSKGMDEERQRLVEMLSAWRRLDAAEYPLPTETTPTADTIFFAEYSRGVS